MCLSLKEICEKFTALISWDEIPNSKFEDFGIINLPDAKVISSYKVGEIYNINNTLTLYYYGEEENFIEDLAQSYESLKNNEDEQIEYGIKPMHWEFFGKNNLLSVLKQINNAQMYIVDLFFMAKNGIYSFHTYIPKEEKDLTLQTLVKKYPYIKHTVEEINEL